MRIIYLTYILLYLALATTNCSKISPEPLDVSLEIQSSYDVFIIMGQSNTNSGKGLDPTVDYYPSSVFQFGRKFENNYQIIPAVEPLDNHHRPYDQIGFANQFSKLYAEQILEEGRKLLLIPCGLGATSFYEGHWNKGDTLYTDAFERARHVLENTDSALKGILWHQGESDSPNRYYQNDLDEMIQNFRIDIGSPNLPFLLGGLCPDWVDEKPEIRKRIDDIISSTPDRVDHTGFADPRNPSVIHTDPGEYVHYSAEDQREMGERYFQAYKEILD